MRTRKQQVELVEGADPGDSIAGGQLEGVPSASPGERGWRRIRRAWPLALAAVVVAGAYLVTGARERAALAAKESLFQGQRAWAPQLSRASVLRWSIETSTEMSVPPIVSAGTVMVGEASPGGEPIGLALDVETGAERWRVGGAPGEMIFCGLPREILQTPDDAVVCLVQQVDDEGAPGGAARLEHRDARTGAVRSRLDWPREHRSSYPWRDGFLVLDEGPQDASLVFLDAEGEQRWSVPALDRQVAPQEFVQLSVLEDHALAVTGEEALLVDLEGNAVTLASPECPHDEPVESEVLMPLMTAEWLYDGSVALSCAGGDADSALVVDPEGRQLYEITLEAGSFSRLSPSAIALDDGSLGPVHVWSNDSRAVVVDAATGETRATIDGGSWRLLVLDGAVVVDGGGAVRVIDVATGEERWDERQEGELVASDGSVVVVVTRDVGSARVRALALDSGRELWGIDLETPEAQAFTDGGYLFVHDGQTFSRLG